MCWLFSTKMSQDCLRWLGGSLSLKVWIYFIFVMSCSILTNSKAASSYSSLSCCHMMLLCPSNSWFDRFLSSIDWRYQTSLAKESKSIIIEVCFFLFYKCSTKSFKMFLLFTLFQSLVENGEMILSDGRRIVPGDDPRIALGNPDLIPIHPDFRMIVLANRPGFPFLGNDFFAALGKNYIVYLNLIG